MILEGTASVDRAGESLAELGPGDFFGEAAVLEATRRNATVTATSDMTVGALFGADFAKYEHDSPELHARDHEGDGRPEDRRRVVGGLVDRVDGMRHIRRAAIPPSSAITVPLR